MKGKNVVIWSTESRGKPISNIQFRIQKPRYRIGRSQEKRWPHVSKRENNKTFNLNRNLNNNRRWTTEKKFRTGKKSVQLQHG